LRPARAPDRSARAVRPGTCWDRHIANNELRAAMNADLLRLAGS
jgi:hypothetical protein